MVILIGVLIYTVYTDMRHYKISNFCILAGMISGLIMTFVSYSFVGVASAVIQAAAIFAVFYPFYLLGGLGAGDIKLFMALGCFLQRERLIGCLLTALIIAGAASAVKMLIFEESRQRLYYLGRYIRKAAFTGVFDEYETDLAQKRSVIRLSVPVLISVILNFAAG